MFAGPELNVGFYPTPDVDITLVQAVSNIGISITPSPEFKITSHIGLGYETLVIKNATTNPSGFAFNVSVGIGYNF